MINNDDALEEVFSNVSPFASLQNIVGIIYKVLKVVASCKVVNKGLKTLTDIENFETLDFPQHKLALTLVSDAKE
jgi:hypothetical protein